MEPLKVQFCDFHVRTNSKNHCTTEYDFVNADEPTPVLRRGGFFKMTIGGPFPRNFTEGFDNVKFIFSFGSKPNISKGTKAVCLLQNVQTTRRDPQKWQAFLERNDRVFIIVKINIPPDAPVGIWKCKILMSSGDNYQLINEYNVPNDIYILFNPWNPQDTVYIENEKEREEYINCESGKIWCGTFKQPSGKHWIFGQFDEVVLPTAMVLLEKSKLDPQKRGSPAHVARAISAVVNAVDESGLLEGRWDGVYEEGTSPHTWTGTVPILENYLENGASSVKYGQCWVYSAATVTICRALGIPCRSVTVYVSAHDTNQSLTVDKYFDIFGNKITDGPVGDNNENCWNFHVWNDVWMSRPDLPPGNDGWQVIDATPQERSDGIMTCGPAPIEAVKKGEVGLQFDTPFVFAAINADVIHYKEDPESEWGFSRLSINKRHVGRKILTKKVGIVDESGDSDLLDITHIYKNPEGTEADRNAVYHAVKGVRRNEDLHNIGKEDNKDVLFELIDIDTVPIGSDFDVTVKFHNRSNEIRTVGIFLSVIAEYYRGHSAETIQKGHDTFKIQPDQENTMKITVTPTDYLDKLVDHGIIKIYAIADVKETKQTWSDEDDFTFIKPRIVITVPQVIKVLEKFEVNFSFRNPLEIPLTNCSYSVEGPGHRKRKSIKYTDVKPKELVSLTEKFVAKKSGKKKIVINFTSKQIHDISGTTAIIVE